MAEQQGIPIRPDELRAAAKLVAADTYKGELVLLALAQIIERLEAIEQKQSEFECKGGRCVYD